MRAPQRLLAVAILATAATTNAPAQETEECTIPTDDSHNFKKSTDIAIKVPGVLTPGEDKTDDQTKVDLAVTSWEHRCGRHKLPKLYMANENGRLFDDNSRLPAGTDVFTLRRGTQKEIGLYGLTQAGGQAICAQVRLEAKEVIWYTAKDESRSLPEACQDSFVVTHELGHVLLLEDMVGDSYTGACKAQSIMGSSPNVTVKDCETVDEKFRKDHPLDCESEADEDHPECCEDDEEDEEGSGSGSMFEVGDDGMLVFVGGDIVDLSSPWGR